MLEDRCSHSKAVGREPTGEDWPTTYDGTLQDDLFQQPPVRYSQVRLWYTDGFLNVFKGQQLQPLLYLSVLHNLCDHN